MWIKMDIILDKEHKLYEEGEPIAPSDWINDR
jgi:hypothetical protein